MPTYTYWSNDPTWHNQKLFEVVANSVAEADKQFEMALGYNPAKKNHIGVTISDK